MPEHRVHRVFAKKLGLSMRTAMIVDRVLDSAKDHRTTHNERGILFCWELFGRRGAEYAFYHVLLDKIEDELKRTFRR